MVKKKVLFNPNLLNNNFKKVWFKYCHKRAILVCDLLFVACFVVNSFALLVTNAMVVKNSVEHSVVGQKLVFEEINPVSASFLGAKQTEKHFVRDFLRIIFRQFTVWGFLIMAYLRIRFNLSEEWHLELLWIMMITLFILLNYDFVNDLGYWIGTKLYS